jgi:hypothetical protein
MFVGFGMGPIRSGMVQVEFRWLVVVRIACVAGTHPAGDEHRPAGQQHQYSHEYLQESSPGSTNQALGMLPESTVCVNWRGRDRNLCSRPEVWKVEWASTRKPAIIDSIT